MINFQSEFGLVLAAVVVTVVAMVLGYIAFFTDVGAKRGR